ncbi:MAG: hypothetical protein PHO62_08015 [Sulfurimonas sp.]|uniref:hypothetical protein n=1 Tax=Sulfurimonas sp. TaxID=2022749 RepID=UPI002626A8D7|nr:hypothetical protein [Sulfurimonas sp.]MDD5373353.1 hypothetical protein [Sulfurimonas sp.]
MNKKLAVQKIKFVKAVYGEDKYKNCDTVQFGDKILVGWYICGYPTLESLEKTFNDEEILELHEQGGGTLAMAV